MESSDDWSYLQVHLWHSTSRKMTYPKSVRFFLLFYHFPERCECLSLCQDTLADEENICFGGRHEVGKESDDDEDQKVDE